MCNLEQHLYYFQFHNIISKFVMILQMILLPSKKSPTNNIIILIILNTLQNFSHYKKFSLA